MRDYELVLLLNPDLEEEAVKEATTKATDLIKKNKGEVKKVDTWGKRRLAYPIAAQKSAHYVVVNFQGEEKTVSELARVLRITDEVLRFMVTRAPLEKKSMPLAMKRALERPRVKPRKKEENGKS